MKLNIHDYWLRSLSADVLKYLQVFPVVAILGPRQCGKSTLARHFIEEDERWVYLDLERPSDLRKLDDPELFFENLGKKSLCLDEVQLRPDLFPVLRSLLDSYGENGKVMILGSASQELLRQSSETLAGRIGYVELTPFTASEVLGKIDDVQARHWLQGGFPRSFLADEEGSSLWKENFVRTYLERDLPSLGFHLTPNQISRLLRMCAHSQGQLLNSSKLGSALGVSHTTLRKWLDILEKTFMLRLLEPMENNLKKRLVKSPKVYVRDSGILHSLLEIESMEELFGHPVYGSSWEGYVIENILTQNLRWKGSFYRSTQGAELDLILSRGQRKLAIECKSSLSPVLGRGFWNAIEDVQPESTWIVVPGGNFYPIRENVFVCSLEEFFTQNKDILDSNHS